MTVKELREFLSDLPDDMKVVTWEYEGQICIDEQPRARVERIGPISVSEAPTLVEANGVKCVLIS
jgi:hypothetical protein